AVLSAKLPHLDTYNKARREAAKKYSAALKGNEHLVVPKIVAEDEHTHVFHQYCLRVTNGKRDALVDHLQEKDIPCGIYYPVPLHRQKAYADDRYRDEDFAETNKACAEVVALPMHSELEDDQIDYITSTVNAFI